MADEITLAQADGALPGAGSGVEGAPIADGPLIQGPLTQGPLTDGLLIGDPIPQEVGLEQVAQGSEGMPQLDITTFPNQIFWVAVALIVIYFILTRFAIPRIGTILAERQGTITNDIAAAEEFKLRAQEAEQAYEAALAEARAEASRIVERARAEIQEDLDAEIARADAQIAAKASQSEAAIAAIREGALDSVREVARETAQALVAAMGVTPDEAVIARAVEAQVKG